MGERQTEDMKVPGSIPGLGIISELFASGCLCNCSPSFCLQGHKLLIQILGKIRSPILAATIVGPPTHHGRGESGWCSDVTSTHGAWRHAEVRFLLPGVCQPGESLCQRCASFATCHMHANSTLFQMVGILGTHPSDPGSSPSDGRYFGRCFELFQNVPGSGFAVGSQSKAQQGRVA